MACPDPRGRFPTQVSDTKPPVPFMTSRSQPLGLLPWTSPDHRGPPPPVRLTPAAPLLPTLHPALHPHQVVPSPLTLFVLVLSPGPAVPVSLSPSPAVGMFMPLFAFFTSLFCSATARSRGEGTGRG